MFFITTVYFFRKFTCLHLIWTMPVCLCVCVCVAAGSASLHLVCLFPAPAALTCACSIFNRADSFFISVTFTWIVYVCHALQLGLFKVALWWGNSMHFLRYCWTCCFLFKSLMTGILFIFFQIIACGWNCFLFWHWNLLQQEQDRRTFYLQNSSVMSSYGGHIDCKNSVEYADWRSSERKCDYETDEVTHVFNAAGYVICICMYTYRHM
jgi:hypothetical protein